MVVPSRRPSGPRTRRKGVTRGDERKHTPFPIMMPRPGIRAQETFCVACSPDCIEDLPARDLDADSQAAPHSSTECVPVLDDAPVARYWTGQNRSGGSPDAADHAITWDLPVATHQMRKV